MNPFSCLSFVHLFTALALIGTNGITGLQRSHVNRLPSRDGRSTKGLRSIRSNSRQSKTEGGPIIDIVKSWRIKRDNSHLQANNDSNSKPCKGNSCLWSAKQPFKTKPRRSVVNRRRRRQSVFLAKALDMLDHARPGEDSNFATRATANRPFKPITTINNNTNKITVKNSTLINKPTMNQSGDKRQGWSDPTGEMRPRFFFNSAPAEYVEQKPPSLRAGTGPDNLALPPETRAGPPVPAHLHRMNPFLKGVNNGLHVGKHPVHFPHIPATFVGNPLSHRMTGPSHFHNHLRHHQFGPPPYAIHINAPPRLEPPLSPPNLIPQNIPPFPQPPPEILGGPMPPLNPPVGFEPPHSPGNDAAMPGHVKMLPPGGIPMPPPPINLPESIPPEDLSPVLPPRPPSGVEPPPPDFEIMPPAEIPVHTNHPIDGPTGAPNNLQITPPLGIPMPPPDFQIMPPPETPIQTNPPMDTPIGMPSNLHMTPPQGNPMSPLQAALQGISMPGEEPPMPLPHHVHHVPFPVAVPSPPRIENVPYPVPIPGPPSIQPLVVPVQVPSPPKIQRVPVPVESPPKIQNVPVPVPVAVPSPPQIKHVPYPVALPVKEPGEIQKIFYPIAVPQPSQIHHVPFPVYIRYPSEIRRVPFPVALPPKPFPVPVPSPPHYVIHRVPYPVMFPQKVPYPVPLVVQHHHIHEDVGNTRESVSNGQCLVNLCLNGGTCSAYMNTYRCHCPNGFQGKHCEEQNTCEPNPCKNFGTCSQVEHEYECTCTKGFIGKNCDRADPCVPSPCENGATCSSDGSSYSCTCRIGWIGKNCQVESKCLPINPCQNGGTCTEAQGRYQCDCTPGWSGLSCEVICENCHTSDDIIEQRNKLRHRLTAIKKWKENGSENHTTNVTLHLSPTAEDMDLRHLTIVVFWLGLGLCVGSLRAMSFPVAEKGKSTVRGRNMIKKSSQSHQRLSNIRTHLKQHLSSEMHNPKKIIKRRKAFRLNTGKIAGISRGVIAISKLKHGFLKQIPQETENHVYHGRRNIAYHKPPSFPSHLDFKVARRDEDGVLKRSRNRVRLKNKKTQARNMESSNKWLPKKENITLNTKGPQNTNASMEMKRQRISDGVMFANKPNEFLNEGMQLNENPDSFFANPLAAKPEQRILHSSHFFSPAVHKFLPAEHRFSGEPIHRYLSSPVLFKDADREGFAPLDTRGDSNGPFEGAPMPPLFEGPPRHGNRVIIINRPIHTPVPVPVHGPPRISVIHHPVLLPPQQVPVPVPIPGPRPPQYIVVHREFSRPAIDPCGVNPCRNGGTCTAVITDFKCICSVGYKGERCEVQSRCLPNPCKNFGKCTELPEDFECTCHTGFHGKTCDLESKCEPNPCRNGGVCTENIDNYICSCAAGFMGKNCERESKCLPINPCKNGGMCTEDLSGYKCNCKDGFDGINCEVRQTSTSCDSTPCLNGGTCITDIYDFSKFSCYCASGFTGLSCEEKGFQSLVLSNPLSNSPCAPFNPCLFGGHCLPDGEDYTCLCPADRGGSHCEHLFHESSCNGCHHHAVCISSQCTCRKGYWGDGHRCRPKTSPCHPNPCENGGTCRENDTLETSQSDWWCECPKGYSGKRCHEFDPCSKKKCYNGGTCEVIDKEPKCNCDEPYEGESCLLDNACLPKNGEKRDPCNNGGKCEFTDGKVTCVCPTRYDGPTCALDKCAKCDKNAYCENGACKCRPPYEGDGITCTNPEEEKPKKAPTNPSELANGCNPNKCKNGAECIEGKSTFFCVCPEGTFGRLCEKKITPTTPPPKAACHPNPCLNGGMCKETGVNQDFECICPNPRFKGRFCDVDMCAECDPHARCINGKCFCRRGYSGDGFSCKRVKPKCPPYSYTVTGDICICNPGYYMNNTGKRACIPITATSRTTMQHGTQLQIPPPALGSTETGGGQQWSEDIVVTEYRSLGCWADTSEWRDPSKRAMMVMEGLDPNLADNYHERKQPISKCADVAKRLGLKVFAIQNGGQCFGGADDNGYKRYGSSENCGDGVGGTLANDVYKL
ncbi:unnamed protein product [Pocillopora meandrina]|uniref:EGF-like domain-containing protein n=1 Tax=Pocillopora meandrina TaxID=46732 RepID=A0AAU9X910_9CNID|nr:unnamed protein product [Pocillopora meandrina]